MSPCDCFGGGFVCEKPLKHEESSRSDGIPRVTTWGGRGLEETNLLRAVTPGTENCWRIEKRTLGHKTNQMAGLN